MPDDGEARRPLDDQAIAAIQAGLDRILASDTFRGAPQLSAFLSFVVARAIAGRAAELKGYTIAVEAFGRPPEFDPQSDPIVRVEAGRLRKALSHYYGGEGTRDPLRISMPVGGYVPVFELSAGNPELPIGLEDVASAPGSALAVDPGASRRWWFIIVAVLLAGLAALLVWYRDALPETHPASVQGLSTTEAADAPTATSSHLPVVAIAVADIPGDPEVLQRVRYFARALIDAMSRFDDLVTIRASPVGAPPAEGADYVFDVITTPIGDQTESFARLRSVRDGRIVWSASRSQPRGAADEQELGEIARRLAVRLAEPFGIIHADFRQVATSPAMRCVFQALDFRRTMKPEAHLAARMCLEAALDQDRTFHAAWAQLALLTLDEYTSGLNPQPGPPLDRALGAALNAVRYAPSSARAQQVMMDVLFARSQTADALVAGRQALSYNPYDPDIMADLGARLIQLDRPAEGLPLLQKAIETSRGRPPWYDFFAYLGARLTGANRLADGYAAVLFTDGSFLGLLGRAMQSAAANDEIALAAAVAALLRVSPAFGVDPRMNLAIRGFSPVVADKIMDALGPSAADLLRPR